MTAKLRRTGATLLVAAAVALNLGSCATPPATLDELLAQLEESHNGLLASAHENSDGLVVTVDLQHMEGADAALADAIVDEADEQISASNLDLPNRWTYRMKLPAFDGSPSVIDLWSDSSPSLRTILLDVVPAAGCQAVSNPRGIHVACRWLEATQAEGVRSAATLLPQLPTELSPFTLEAWADDHRTSVRTFEGVTEDHIELLEAAAVVFSTEPQDQVIITFASPTSTFGSFDEDVSISVLDPDASIAPDLQTVIDASPLWVRATMTDGNTTVAELVDASP